MLKDPECTAKALTHKIAHFKAKGKELEADPNKVIEPKTPRKRGKKATGGKDENDDGSESPTKKVKTPASGKKKAAAKEVEAEKEVKAEEDESAD